MATRRFRAFTLIELLLVVGVIALLIGIVVPALGAARHRARVMLRGTRLQQLSVATALYLGDWDNALPQARFALPEGGEDIIGPLFGGKKGRLPQYGVDTIGPE